MAGGVIREAQHRLRVVILISVFARGGAERQAYLLAREWKRRDVGDVEVWALMFDGPYRQAFEEAGIPTRVLAFRKPDGPLRWIRRLARVASQLREGRIDVLLPFTTWPNVVAALTWRFTGVKACIWGERSSGAERVAGYERIAVRLVRRFVANSTAGVAFLVGEMGVEPSAVSLVSNGVDMPPDSDGNWRERSGLSSDRLLVVKIANLTHLKDHATLIRAWRIVQETWGAEPRPVLALAGLLGNRYAACQELVDRLLLGDDVLFLGPVADIVPVIRAADLAVFSSHVEGMPNGILECMALGKAVVTTDLPGTRDALGDEFAQECFVRVGDAGALADRMTRLLREPRRRAEIGAANRSRVSREFSMERMSERYLQVLNDELGRMNTRIRNAAN